MKKSIIALAAGTVFLGALSVPSLSFAEPVPTSANISSESPYTPPQGNKKWVSGIKGATVKEDMKSTVPTQKFYMTGGFGGNISLYKWQQKGNNKVCPLYQGYIYKMFP
ncbi:hypothetical protein [Paenibacillus polymyxa]|uniref:hypothetical protein n=1 Tax=Paenibacillus polymyxa TaxID=1406 RepID=UPI00129ACC08|nr:hypothetical protein [Paenibacillus polymyxa]KAE8558106.1 hypothetical protein BJH92_21950 [Paenibacillus polymyxa]MCJ1219350.1 hypothetical protein [Paenibacillus polymyxa]